MAERIGRLQSQLRNAALWFCAFMLLGAMFVTMTGFASDARAAADSRRKKDMAAITIFAEKSMVKLVTELARFYSEKYGVIASARFNTAANLIAVIQDGDPADVYIAANSKWVDILKQQGLVDVYHLASVAKDSLALVANATSQQEDLAGEYEALGSKQHFLEWILNEKREVLIIDSNSTSAGLYTQNLFELLNIPGSKVFSKIDEDRKSIAGLVASDKHYLGLTFASNIKGNDKVAEIYRFDEELDNEVFYQAAVIAGDNMERGRHFVKFLQSDDAKVIFTANGLRSL